MDILGETEDLKFEMWSLDIIFVPFSEKSPVPDKMFPFYEI